MKYQNIYALFSERINQYRDHDAESFAKASALPLRPLR